jgi:hypothetical protein
VPVERGRRGGRLRREAPPLVVLRDPRAVGALVAVVVVLALAQNLVIFLQGGAGPHANLRPVFKVVAVLVACVAGDRIGNVRILGWTSIASLLCLAVARLTPVSEVSALLVVVAEASLVGGIPLTVLVAQDLRWVSRALVTGLVFGLRYWSEYLAIIVVALGISDGGGASPTPSSIDTLVVVSGMLIAVGYLMIRVFDRLAPAPESEDSLHGP